MYGFHKVSRHKDSTSFRHEHFYLGNEDNFNLIHRKRKEGEEEGSSQDEPAVEDTKMEIPAETAVSAIIAQFVAFKN